MARVIIRLDPRLLDNPDADIRYRLPDLLAERSAGVITDDGYDYVGDGPLLVLYLEASEVTAAVACILEVVQNIRVVDNDLRRATVVAVERDGGHDVIYPTGFVGPFLAE